MYRQWTFSRALQGILVLGAIAITLSCAPKNTSMGTGSIHGGDTEPATAEVAASGAARTSVPRIQAWLEPAANLNYMLGYMAELDNNPEAALEHYSKVLQVDPEAALVKKRLASVLFNLGQFKDVIAYARAALNMAPDDMELIMLLGQTYSNLNRPEEAIDMFERLDRHRPNDLRTRLHLSVLYSTVRKYGKSMELLKPMLKTHKDSALPAMTYIGSIAIAAGDLDDAERIFLNAGKHMGESELVYFNLATIYDRKGKAGKAEKYYKKTIKVNPSSAAAMEGLAQLYLKQRKDKEALAVLNVLVEKFPDNTDAMKRRALLLMNLQMYGDAIVALRQVISTDPVDTPFRYYLGLAYEESKKYDEAIAEYKKLIAVEPENTKPYLSLGYLYIQLELYDEAEDTYRALLQVSTPMADYYVYLSRALILNKDNEGALESLLEGLTEFPDNAELHFNIAVLYEEQDKFDEVVDHLSRAIEVNPEHADAMNFLGYSYAERGIKLEEALALVTESLNLKPGNGYITDSLGWVYYKMGRTSDALATLSKAVRIVKDDPVIYEHLGDALLASSSRDKALKSWKQSLEVLDKSDMHEEEAADLRRRVEDKIRRHSAPAE